VVILIENPVILDFDDIQARTVLGAMKSVAAEGTAGLSEMDHRTIKAAGTIALGLEDVNVNDLVEPTPDGLAALLHQSGDAQVVIRMLAVVSLVGEMLDPKKTQRLQAFATALSVDEEYLEILDDATSGKIGRATDRLAQRGAEYFLPRESGESDLGPVESLMPFGDGDEKPAMEARYASLGKLHEGTFGKAFFDHFNDNDLELPGNEHGQTETFVTPHDSSHVLGGYSTDERGEILVAAFIGAMHPRKPMESQIVPAMFSWHLGIKLSWLGGSNSGAFEPQAFWTAWDRGKDMKVDLFDPGWDFWSATDQPLEEVRHACGVREVPTHDLRV